MYDKVSLGIRGDLNLLKKHMAQNSDCSRYTSFFESDKKDAPGTVEIEIKNNPGLLSSFLNILAEYIIERYEAQMAERIISEDYSYLSQTQKRVVMRSLSDLNDDGEIGYYPRKKAIFESLCEYVKSESDMLLEGFVSFRLKEYESLLSKAVHYLAEKSIIEQEYNDFIDLLKYFVNIQTSRPKLVHVVVESDGSYELISDEKENITKKAMSDFVDINDLPDNINYDDLLISMLITLAPKAVVVHNSKLIKNKELFKTIDLVFDKNMIYCSGCEMCKDSQAVT
ncbi:MAG: putative sporulation protein YtxC [Clostridia bacterium]|nr:putative sporulation protein YtxC [Clostridia bacterium]